MVTFRKVTAKDLSEIVRMLADDALREERADMKIRFLKAI